MAYDENKLARLKHLKQVAQKAKAESDAVAARVKALENVGAQANKIESIKVNGACTAIHCLARNRNKNHHHSRNIRCCLWLCHQPVHAV